MDKVLFEEIPAENHAYRWRAWIAAIGYYMTGALLLVLGVYLIVALSDFPLLAVLCGVIFLSVAGLSVWYGIGALAGRRQYIRIYGDRIEYQQPLQKSPQQIFLRPEEYTVKLSKIYSRSVYSVQFVFLNQKGEKVLTYKAPTLFGSLYQSPRYKWEDDLLALGCEIVDEQEVIVNRGRKTN